MSEPLFVPRTEWFDGTPTNNNGTPRPRLKVPVPTITRHYTGSPPSIKAKTWAAEDFMPWFQSVALSAGKSYEYNYVIPPRAVGVRPQVWEYAGSHQAAHSSGENDVAIGVLFAIGVSNFPTAPIWEPLTDGMVDAYRWLRDVLLERSGFVLPTVAELEHRAMPGAATACPGDSVIARAADLSKPYTTPPEGPVRYFKTAADSLTIWATADDLNATRLEEFTAKARNVDVFAVQPIPADEAAKFVYHFGATSQSVK